MLITYITYSVHNVNGHDNSDSKSINRGMKVKLLGTLKTQIEPFNIHPPIGNNMFSKLSMNYRRE